jgi:phytol kinase
MTTKDLLMLIFSFVIVAIIILGSQRLHKMGSSLLFTRKLVHVLIGCWVIPAMWGFDTPWVAAILPFVALIGNTISFFTGLVSSIELKHDKPNYGTILYPFSFVIILLVFFPGKAPLGDYWYAGMLGILLMTFGDTAAGVYGRKYGKGKYTIVDETRTVEGSMAMLITSFIVSWLVFMVANTGFGFWAEAILALFVAMLVTALEAISIRGWDNFLVPIGAAFLTVLLVNVL